MNVSAQTKYSPNNDVLTKMENWKSNIINNSGLAIKNKNIVQSVYNKGNRELVANVIKKAMNGEKITLVAFGGSITQGANYTGQPIGINHRYTNYLPYVDLVGNWFADMFKGYGAEVIMKNAGIGSTDTVFGIHRLNDDVLKYKPDLVIMEWDKNDGQDVNKQATYENIIRKLLQKGIAVVMMGFCGGDGSSSQNMHEPIAKHYDLPYISYKNAFSSEDWLSKLTLDNVHPNIVGHHLAALILTSYFADVYKDIETIASSGYKIPETPYNMDATLYGEGYIATFENIEAGKIKGIKMISTGSFKKQTDNYRHGPRILNAYAAKYSQSYEPMVLEVSNLKTLFFMLKKSYGIADGKFKIKIDGKEITNSSFSSAASNYHNEEQMSRVYAWASERAFISKDKKSIKLEIYPINQVENEYVGIYGLFVTGDFEVIDSDTDNNEISNTIPPTGGNYNDNIMAGNDSTNTTGVTGSTITNNLDSNSDKVTNSSNNETNVKDTTNDGTEVEVETIIEKRETFFSRNKTLLTTVLITGLAVAVAGLAFVVFLIVKHRT